MSYIRANETVALTHNKRGTLAIALLGMLIAQIDTSVVNLALPAIGKDLQAGVGALQWVVDAFNLVYGGLLLTAGTLGDLYGRKRVFLIGIALFCAGSVACALAPTPETLIAGRIVAGLGAALDVPLTLALLSVAYPDPRERAHALGIWAGSNGLAFIIGPTVGGLLVGTLGWRSIFWMVVPFGIATFAMTLRIVKETKGESDRRLDPIGQILLIAGLSTATLAAIEGRGWGWQSLALRGCLAAAVLALIAFVMVERRSDNGLAPLRFFAIRRLSGGLAVAAAMTFGMYGMLFLIPSYFQVVRGADAFTAGLELLPMSAIFFIVSQGSGRLIAWLGPRAMMVAGMLCMGGGVFGLAAIKAATGLVWIESWMIVIGIGLGLNTATVLGQVVGALGKERAGTASGLANTARMIGATLGVAILGTLFALGKGPGADAAHFLTGMGGALRFGGTVLLIGAAVALVTTRSNPQAKR